MAHDIVVVRGATKKSGLDRDPEIQRLQVRACVLVCIYKLNSLLDENLVYALWSSYEFI